MTPMLDGVQAVLFDLDGTLLDTVADLHTAINGMLADLGYPLLPEESPLRRHVLYRLSAAEWSAAATSSTIATSASC